MGFLQWLTAGVFVFVGLLILGYLQVWSRPKGGVDFAQFKDLLTLLTGILGVLVGFFVQESRVQDKTELAQTSAAAADTAQQALREVSTVIGEAAAMTPGDSAIVLQPEQLEALRSVKTLGTEFLTPSHIRIPVPRVE